MESQEQFYVTLPSNNSMNYFPNNVLSSFKTKLATPLSLQGEWEVALVEFIYPFSWFNVNSRNNKFSLLEENQEIYTGFVPKGYYADTTNVCNAIKKSLPETFRNRVNFNTDENTGRVDAAIDLNSALCLSQGLGQLLGYPEGVISSSTRHAPFSPDMDGGLHALYVYTDIIENQRVGDISAPLLKIVSVNRKKSGEVVSHSFQRPHYYPVKSKYIDIISIDIRSDVGEKVPFESGKVIAILHFRSLRKPSLFY